MATRWPPVERDSSAAAAAPSSSARPTSPRARCSPRSTPGPSRPRASRSRSSSTSALARPTSRPSRTGRSTSSRSTPACWRSTSTKARPPPTPRMSTPSSRPPCRTRYRARQVGRRGQGRHRRHQGDGRGVLLEVDRGPRGQCRQPHLRWPAGVEDAPHRHPRPQEGLRPGVQGASGRSTPVARSPCRR